LRDSKPRTFERSTKAGRERKSKIRVLLSDDHEAILTRVRTLLDGDFDVVGAVNNGRDAIMEVLRLDPDVLVIDISLPILDGFQVVSQLGSSLRTKVVFLTLHLNRDFVAAAFSLGASAYVVKSDATTDLIPAIREAFEGRRYVSQSTPS
jgi:DNA-binding NarL/FixJ family response regulator